MPLEPWSKPLWFKRFPTEDHRLQLQLTAQFRLQRVNRLQGIERGRGLAQHRHLLGNQQAQQVLWRSCHRL